MGLMYVLSLPNLMISVQRERYERYIMLTPKTIDEVRDNVTINTTTN